MLLQSLGVSLHILRKELSLVLARMSERVTRVSRAPYLRDEMKRVRARILEQVEVDQPERPSPYFLCSIIAIAKDSDSKG
jgi:hypothetical protein